RRHERCVHRRHVHHHRDRGALGEQAATKARGAVGEGDMRTGEQYIEALRDGRAIFVDGERVADVTDHEAFRGVVRTVASLYDMARDPRSEMTFTDAAT